MFDELITKLHGVERRLDFHDSLHRLCLIECMLHFEEPSGSKVMARLVKPQCKGPVKDAH